MREKVQFRMITGCSNTLDNINNHNGEIDPVVIEFSRKRINLNDSSANQYYVRNKVNLPQNNAYYVDFIYPKYYF